MRPRDILTALRRWRAFRRREILDGYGVRHVIADELRAEGVMLSSVPGRTYAEDL